MKTDDFKGMQLAISTGGYVRPGETFVVRHIRELFAGKTVVVASCCQLRPREDRPVFYRRRASRNLLDLAASPWHLWQSNRRYGSLRVPFGHSRRRLHRFLREHAVGAILCEFGSQGLPMWPVARELGIPIFCYFRGRDATQALRRPSRVRAYRRMLPQLSGIFAVSRFLLDNLAEQGLVHPNQHVVPSGADVQRFCPLPKDRDLILAVGRFVEKKAPQVTIASFLRLAARYPRARLELIGHGPQLRRCQALVARSGFADQIRFHGRQPHDFVRDRMRRAAVFVQHSVTGRNGDAEGLPSAIQEAMACGAAIVSTRHAGIPSAVQEGTTGFLVDEYDGIGFSASLDRLLANPELCETMGHRARSYAVEHFDYRRLYRVVETEIGKAIGRQGLMKSA